MISQMLQDGIVQKSNSPYGAPIVVVNKRQDDGSVKLRLCVDFRAINRHTIAHNHPLPIITELIDSVGDAAIFSVLDLASGFHPIPVAEEDRHKLAFVTLDSHLEFCRLPFGVRNGPAQFARLAKQLLEGQTNCLAFIDDLLIFTKDFNSHMEIMKQVFERLRAAILRCQPSKAVFCKTSVNYLGFLLTPEGYLPDPVRAKALLNAGRPTNVRLIREYLGFVGYYRRHIPLFSQKAKCLTALLKKDAPFIWDENCEDSFNFFKQSLINAPI